MPIEELKEPIWEKQEGETPNQYDYFREFLKFPTNNLRQFHDYLCEKNEKQQKGTKVVTYNTIRKWAREACNKWVFRKAAKRKAEDDDIQDTLHELDKETKIKEFQIKKGINNKLLERIDREINDNALSQITHGIQGYIALKNDNRTDMGEPIETTKSEINADFEVTQEISAKVKLKRIQELADQMENMTYD